jgi:DNA polymerase III delta subunit
MKYSQALSVLSIKQENKFILYGPEYYLKKYFVDVVRKTYPDSRTFFSSDQEEVLSLIGSYSFFEKPFLIIINFNEMDVQRFEKVIKSYKNGYVIVLADKANIKSRAMTNIISGSALIECNKLKEYGEDYPLWIRSCITSAGYKAPEGIEDLIFSRVGPSMSSIASELDKLFIVKYEEKMITENDIEFYVSNTSRSTAFDLFESLLRKDINKALKSFYSYTKNNSTFVDVIAFLSSYFEKIYRMLLLRDKKMDPNDIADIIGLPAFIVRTKYMPRAQSMGKREIASKFNDLCELDARIRLFKGDKKVLLEKFILSFS